MGLGKAQACLDEILKMFESGDLPEAISIAAFPTLDIPCSKWSYLNRLMMIAAGTVDARGFRQWEKAGRKVKKGAKALYILAPKIRKFKAEEEGEEDRAIITGFRCQPVFKLEDTEGEEIVYPKLSLPEMRFSEVAEAWGIDVAPTYGGGGFLGFFQSGTNSIRMATEEERVFFHELSHAAHNQIKKLKGGQHWNQEIVAELSAAVLSRYVGKETDTTGNSYQYISMYAGKAGKSPIEGCMEVISDVEKVLALIVEKSEEIKNKS